MIQVRAPDGTVIRFPDGTAPAQINQVMGQYHAQTLAQHDARSTAQHNGYGGAGYATMNGYALNRLPEAQGAGAAVRTGVENLFGQGPGYGMADAYHATKGEGRRELQAYAQGHPMASLAANLGGGAVNPALLAGGEWINAARGLLPAMGRAAAVGGAAGGVADGLKGAVVGAATGAAIPAAGGLARKAAGVVSDVGHNLQRAVGMADPAKVAQKRLSDALAKDVKAGVNPVSNVANWPGNSKPTLADVGGENLRSTVRDAGGQGPARQTLQKYRDQVAADLQNHAQTITAKLTPGETRTPQQLAAALEETRSTNASTKYAAPYAQPIGVTPEILQALADPEGAAAIQRAVAGARGRMDYPAVQDLQSLHDAVTSGVAPQDTTGRALDRIQIAFGKTGGNLAAKEGAGDLASGQFMRQGMINSALDQAPGLGEARADYRDLSRQIEAIGHGQKVTAASPSMLADALQGAEAPQLKAAGVGSRDALMTAIGAPTEGAVGALNRLSTNTNTGRNMELIHGPEATGSWRDAIQAEAQRMDNANYMAPNTGSQTHSKGEDSLASLLMHAPHAAMSLAKTAIGGGQLTDAERAAIVNPAIGDISPDLLTALMKAKQAQGMFPGTAYLPAPVAAAAASSGP